MSEDSSIKIDYVIYDYYLKSNQYDKIKKYFTYGISSDSNKEGDIVIADLQAGEGEWLNTFKQFIPYSQQQSKIKYIANELEDQRYNEVLKKDFDYNYLGSFEDLQIPKKSISLLLFNPPYGEDNGERMVRKFLRITLERKLICGGGWILLVVNKHDALDIADLLCKYCYVQESAIYKVNPEEYSKFKQYVILARVYGTPLYDESKPHSAMMLQSAIERYLKVIELEPEFQVSFYNNRISLPSVSIEELMENFEYIQNHNLKVSNNNNVWKWIKVITELKDLGNEKLTLPKQPKMGEIANLLASGYINGNIDLNGKAKHIAVGGTKSVEKQETENKIADDGTKYTETKTIRFSEPYLNLLIQNNGKLEIKELGGNND